MDSATTALAPLDLDRQARLFLAAAKAPNTLRAYRSDWAHFESWCRSHDRESLPAEPATVAYYLTALAATHKPASLQRRLTAITRAHQAAGCSSPASLEHAPVSEVLKGIRRTLGTAQQGKAPLFTADLRRMIEALPSGLRGLRDPRS